MEKSVLALIFILAFSFIHSQTAPRKLKFNQGEAFDISLEVQTTINQQAMGQVIDFNVNATALHTYKVTNATEENTTLNHQVKHVTFSFDGMGQKRKFDSRVEKDLNGQFGKPVKELLEKKYDMIIDTSGKVLMAMPEKVTISTGDSRMAMITNMLKDVFDLVQPPQKGKGSFFAILPTKETGKGQPWTESYVNDQGKFDAAYTISEINDSTIIIDFATSSLTVSKAEMMGSETVTTMNNKSTGKIIVNAITGIMIEKNMVTESTGNTETSFGTLPVTAKTVSTMKVREFEN